jgi:hypothetical protein
MCGVNVIAAEESGNGVEGNRAEHIFFAQIFQNFEMKRAMMPGVAFGQIESDLNGHGSGPCLR